MTIIEISDKDMALFCCRSKNKLYRTVFTPISIVLLITALAFPALVFSQPSTPVTLESLIQDIEGRAQRDVDRNKQAKGTSELKTLFGEKASALGLDILKVEEIYEEAYAAASSKKQWWKPLIPRGEWIVAVIVVLLGVLDAVFKGYLTQFVKQIFTATYSQLASYRPFWFAAVRSYREKIVAVYAVHKDHLRSGQTFQMDDIFVPLKVVQDANRISDYSHALSEYRRLMVVGKPGSGKTMLMHHTVHTYAREKVHNSHGNPIPVLFELRRLNNSDESLLTQLTESLTRNKFPKNEVFIKVGLKKGLLILLFDGLDEVKEEIRGKAVTQINDLLEESNCQVVVTCRTAVYKDEFAGWMDQRVEVIEFDDLGIQRFLNASMPELPERKSVAQLQHMLRERPRIMAAAKNPLMLNMIAYLYSDSNFVLPTFPAQIYKLYVTFLLGRRDYAKQLRYKYKAIHKRLVLQSLALFFQEKRSDPQIQNKSSASLVDLLSEVKKVLPSLNLAPIHAGKLLDEIVERSGLLTALDEGISYEFAHSNMQEFFAALALEKKSDQIIQKFAVNPGNWREAAKLWCGLKHDSTALIEAVAAKEPITALECLGVVDGTNAQLFAANRR